MLSDWRRFLVGSLTVAALQVVAHAEEPPLSELAAELERRYAFDQAIRKSSTFGPGVLLDPIGRALAYSMMSVDRDNTAWMKRVVDEHGWPGKSLVGERGAHCAWLLVQHADLDRPFQRRCLELLRAAPDGEVKPRELAYLEDRVLVGEGEPQRFGTQLHVVDGRLVPQPIADPEGVDERRADVGLPPLEEYVEMAARFYQPSE